MAAISFSVIGKPEPAGSKRAFQRGARIVVVDDNPKSREWKNKVASAARGVMLSLRAQPLQGPLYVSMVFTRERPKSHFRSDGITLNSEGQRNEYPTTKPDVLKLTRAVEDAMSKIIYDDDAQIVSENIRKEYGADPGVHVYVMEMS